MSSIYKNGLSPKFRTIEFIIYFIDLCYNNMYALKNICVCVCIYNLGHFHNHQLIFKFFVFSKIAIFMYMYRIFDVT